MSKKQPKKIHLALQGGGAHGAFAWGVLDQLIEDERISIESICATSAGSINAVLYNYGMLRNGREGAKEALYNFWFSLGNMGNVFGSKNMEPFEKILKNVSHSMIETFTHLVSPYQFNPFNYNVIREVLARKVDFDRLRESPGSNIYISTTNVRTGKVRIFDKSEISIDVILASTCLPELFQAVKIGDDHYWDGGYMGNPAIFPLFYRENSTRDVLIVHINPIVRDALPTSASEILNRTNEITFNASLIAELRAVAFVNKLHTQGWLKDEFKDKLKHILVHSIRADEALKSFDVATKFDVNWQFLTHLRDLGKEEAKKWLAKNYDKVGKECSVDLRKEYLANSSSIGRE